MDSASPVVSVVIVNYNSGDHLPRCLDSLFAQTFGDFELIVIDNDSADGSMSNLDGYPVVRRVNNRVNRGFAAGQNQGIAGARGRYILSLNYDLVMAPTFLEELVNALEGCAPAGSACGKLLTMAADGTRTNTIYAAGHQLAPDRFSLLRGHQQPDRGQYDEPSFVFGAPGAAALYRREMIQDISINGQFFDETLFTWYEDVDVDWRAQRCGWRCMYVPTAVAHHMGHVGETFAEPFRSWRAMLTIRNRWLVMAGNETWRELREHACVLAKYESSNLLFVIRTGQLTPYARALCELVRLTRHIRARRDWMRKYQAREAVGGEPGDALAHAAPGKASRGMQ